MLERRSGRARAAPSRLVSDDMDDPLLDPTVGRLYMIQAAGLGVVDDVFMRLPGHRENYSRLKRNVSDAELFRGLRDFDYFIDSLRAFPPPVVLLENVPSLLEGGLEQVLSHIEDALGALAGGRYAIFRDIVCCGDLGARMARPRVFWLLYLT